MRVQFGKPIGSFQAIKQIVADMLCRAEQSAALAWDAARSVGAGAEHHLAAAVAAAGALDAAVENAKDAIQVLGGIGFTFEHDAHLYLRRATTLRLLLGDTPDGALALRNSHSPASAVDSTTRWTATTPPPPPRPSGSPR